MIEAQSDVYTSSKTAAVLFGVVGGVGISQLKKKGQVLPERENFLKQKSYKNAQCMWGYLNIWPKCTLDVWWRKGQYEHIKCYMLKNTGDFSKVQIVFLSKVFSVNDYVDQNISTLGEIAVLHVYEESVPYSLFSATN